MQIAEAFQAGSFDCGGKFLALNQVFRRGFSFAEVMFAVVILGIGFIMAAFDSEKRALHDLMCNTRVIHIR